MTQWKNRSTSVFCVLVNTEVETKCHFHNIMSYQVLYSVPLLLLVIIAALDAADKALLAASFPVLERTLHLDVEALGYFSLFTNLSYALSLPFWGWLVHRYTIHNAHNILSASCLVWGLASLGIAASGDVVSAQAVFRSITGAALASILPLTQTLLVELVPAALRGRAFGIMGLMERAAATLAVAAVVWLQDDWKTPYVVVGLVSIAMAFLSRERLRLQQNSINSEGDDGKVSEGTIMGLWQIVKRIVRIPAFACLVGQGVTGAVPWEMMSFLLLLLDWKGFTKKQIVIIQFSTGVSATIGGALGGVLGDLFVERYSMGRIGVAFVSVVGGIVFYGLFIFADSFFWAVLWSNMFHLWGTWTTAAANRPICAELARNPSERAQIVAAWILLEKTSGAIFGAPLVGYLTKHMMVRANSDEQLEPREKAAILALNLFGLSSFFWALCSVFWILMAAFMRRSDTHDRFEMKALV